MRASQRDIEGIERERERARQEGEKESAKKNARDIRARMPLLAAPVTRMRAYVCITYIRRLRRTNGILAVRRTPSSHSSPPRTPATCPSHRIGAPAAGRVSPFSLPHFSPYHPLYLSVYLGPCRFTSHRAVRRCTCGPGWSVRLRPPICARRPHGDRERERFWMDLERSKICQGDGMGRYRFRKDGTSPRTSTGRCTSSITTRAKLHGSILEIGTYAYVLHTRAYM